MKTGIKKHAPALLRGAASAVATHFGGAAAGKLVNDLTTRHSGETSKLLLAAKGVGDVLTSNVGSRTWESYKKPSGLSMHGQGYDFRDVNYLYLANAICPRFTSGGIRRP